MIELTIKVSNEEKRMTKKHAIYDPQIAVSRDDVTLIALVDEAIKEFNSDVDDVKLIITMVW